MTEQHVCPVCGRKFWVDYPNLWRFKADGKFYCRWNCKREMEKRKEAEEKMAQMRNSTKEMARGLLDAMDAGKDPMDWLREQGYTNPEKAYQNIKARIKDRDPELAKRFPKMRDGRKQAAEEQEETTVELVYDPSIAEEYRREQAQKEANERAKAEELKLKPGGNYRLSVEETPETKKYLWRTAAVRNEILGVFYYDEKHNSVDWRHPMGEEISLPPADWNLLAQSLGKIMHVLGVENQEMEV